MPGTIIPQTTVNTSDDANLDYTKTLDSNAHREAIRN